MAQVRPVSYYFAKMLNTNLDDAIKHTIEILKQEGFGIITEADVKETFKQTSLFAVIIIDYQEQTRTRHDNSRLATLTTKDCQLERI